MNILLLSFEFPPDPGGIGMYAYQIAKNLLPYKHKITAIVFYKFSKIEEQIKFKKKQRIRIECFPSYSGRTIDLLRSFNFFRKIVFEHQIDLILVVQSRLGIVAWLFKILYKIPYMVIGHGSEFISLKFTQRVLIKLIFSSSNCIILNSKYTKSLFDRMSVKNKNIHIVYPGGDPELYKYEKYKAAQKNKKVILSVGALSLRKGLYYVIDAIEILKNKKFDLEYLIIGEGPEKNSLEAYIEKHNLEKYVKLLGFVPTEELPKYYSQADIFVLNSTDDDPTQVEGFGIVTIEAALMKVPVIASRKNGIEEAVIDGKTGLLVDAKNPREIAKKIMLLLTDKTKARFLGQNAYERAIKNFTWEKSAEKIQKLIEKYDS